MLRLHSLAAARTARTVTPRDEIMSTTERVLAADGQSFTSHIKGVNSAGQATNNILVFERE